MDTNQYRDITMCVYVHHTQTHTHTDTHTGIYLWFLQRNRKDLETKECSYKGWRRKAEASEALLNTSFYQFALCNHTILYTGKTEGKKALIPTSCKASLKASLSNQGPGHDSFVSRVESPQTQQNHPEKYQSSWSRHPCN